MLLVVNCQNGYLERCNSDTLRNIVEAAELLDNTRILIWEDPPQESFHKKADWMMKKMDYEVALYPELAQMGRPIHRMKNPKVLPKEVYNDLEKSKEVYIIGANTDNWIVQMAFEIWSNRVKPKFIYDAWFSVGPKGSHSDALSALSRQFGMGVFQNWAAIRDPLLKARPDLARRFSDCRAAAAAAHEAAGFSPDEA